MRVLAAAPRPLLIGAGQRHPHAHPHPMHAHIRASWCDGGGGGRSPPARLCTAEDDGDLGPQLPAWWPLALAALAAAATPWSRRGVRFWAGVSPILLAYALYAARARLQGWPAASRERTLLALHEAQAPRALRLVQSLAGGYVKMGQVLANRADTLPAAYVRAFGTLHSSVPPRPWSRMERSLRRDAPALAGALREVNETALGAASTGQAHLATLRDGSRVVLKCQYPEAAGRFDADFGNVARLFRILAPPLVPVILEVRSRADLGVRPRRVWDSVCKRAFLGARPWPAAPPPTPQVRRRFAREFDYEREAADMADIRAAMGRAFGSRVRVPAPRVELCTRTTLVMEWIPGPTLMDAAKARVRAALGDDGIEYLRSRASGAACNVAPPSRLARLRAAPALWTLRRRNTRRMRLLRRVAATQIFRDGVFNADPHPGNVLLCAGGRQLGLIDYGQVMRLSDAQRLALARLIVALTRYPSDERARARTGARARARAAAEVAAAASDLGFRTRRMSDEGLASLASYMFDRDQPGLGPAQTLRAIDAADPIVRLPEDVILAARVSLLLRGTSQLLAQQRPSIAAAWADEARRTVRTLEAEL